MLFPGSFVGRYQLQRKMHSTLHGERYLAKSTTSFHEDTVVIKLWYTTNHHTALFHGVVRAYTQLQHPFILPIIDFGTEDGIFYIVTSYRTPAIETLRGRMTTCQGPEPMPSTDALNILTQVGLALQFAHERKVLHGQLTPDSIFMTSTGTALLSDLGVANLRDITMPTDMPPSAVEEQYAYSSPEQLRGEISEASDQYALGCIAYELFTGVRYQPLTPPCAVNPALSPLIEEVIVKAIAPWPASRFENITVFIDALTYAVTLPAGRPMQTMEEMSEGTSPSFAFHLSKPPMAFSTPRWPTYSDQPRQSTEHDTTVPHLSELLPPLTRASQEPSYIVSSSTPSADRIWSQRKAHPRGIHHAIRQRRTLTIAILLMAVIPFFLFTVLSFVPASAAVVKVMPSSKHLEKTYTFNDKTDATQHSLTAHTFTYITPKQTRIVPATGRSYQDATSAQGALVFSNATHNQTINTDQTFATKSGVEIAVNKSFTINVGQTILAPAHAVKRGASGNIPANAINSAYPFADVADPTLVATVFVENVKPFTGGQEARDVTVVQQSDIDQVVNPLVTQLTFDAQTKLLSMIQPDQLPIGQARCTPNTQTQPNVNAIAQSAKVSVEVVCLLDTYVAQEIRDAVVAALLQDGQQEFGIYYLLQENVIIDKPVVDSSPIIVNGAQRFHVKVDSVWVYQFTPATQQKILQSIAGKNQFSAMDYLQHCPGVGQATISTSGMGRALPVSIQTIQFMPMGGGDGQMSLPPHR